MNASVNHSKPFVKYYLPMTEFNSFGKRVRHARKSNNLSQSQLARAINRLSMSECSKSLVSAWENDRIKNPHNRTMLALQAATSFRHEWITTGQGPQRVSLDDKSFVIKCEFDQALLERAIEAAVKSTKDVGKVARAAVVLYSVLTESPNLDAAALVRLAGTVNG